MSRTDERMRDKKARRLGMEAAMGRKPLTANPYNALSTRGEWDHGWKVEMGHKDKDCKGTVCGVGHCTGYSSEFAD